MFKKLLALSIMSVFAFGPALSYALITWGYGQTPNDIRLYGNAYKGINPYSKNFYNPYSVHQNLYDPNSFWRDQDRYAAQVTDYNLKPQGYVSMYTNAPHAVTNPYSPAGNLYFKNNPLNPYNLNSNKRAYTTYQNPYDPESLNQSGKYARPIYDSNRDYRGSTSAMPYHSENHLNPYSPYGNPYDKGVANPYLANPYDHFGKY